MKITKEEKYRVENTIFNSEAEAQAHIEKRKEQQLNRVFNREAILNYWGEYAPIKVDGDIDLVKTGEREQTLLLKGDNLYWRIGKLEIITPAAFIEYFRDLGGISVEAGRFNDIVKGFIHINREAGCNPYELLDLIANFEIEPEYNSY